MAKERHAADEILEELRHAGVLIGLGRTVDETCREIEMT